MNETHFLESGLFQTASQINIDGHFVESGERLRVSRTRKREGGGRGGLGGDVEGDIEVFYDHMIFLPSPQRDEDHM